MTAGSRIYLEVPFAEKDDAKRAGARWDPTKRMWYAPGTLTDELQRWAKPAANLSIEGEDRTFGDSGPSLYVDLVPRTSWASNVRSLVPTSQWRELSRRVRARAGDRCEACRHAFPRKQLAAHERFSFDMSSRTQRLERLVSLCAACHLATHYGFACTQQREAQALEQLERVNGWTRPVAVEHVQAAYAVWEQRSRIDWIVDLSILEGIVSIRMPETPAPATRLQAVVPAPPRPEPPPELLHHVEARLARLTDAIPPGMSLIAVVIHPGDVGQLDIAGHTSRVDTGHEVPLPSGRQIPVHASRSCRPGQMEALITFNE